MIGPAYCLLHPFRFLARLYTKDIHINAEYTRRMCRRKILSHQMEKAFLRGVCGVCVCVCVCASHCRVPLFCNPMAYIAWQASLPIEVSRQEYWSE